MAEAGVRFEELDAIGVTQGPGLVGSLLVGITYGKTLAHALGKPLLAVNHLEGHVRAAFLQAYQAEVEPKLPAVCLIVSGGHTVLYEVKLKGEQNAAVIPNAGASFLYRKLGGTRDDAAGEAYDKVSKLLGLGYPGGPILDRLASAAGSARAPVKFGPTKTRGNAFDFSFSGLKTAVLYHVREHPEYAAGIRQREGVVAAGHRTFEDLFPLCSESTLGLIREFQNAVVRDLVERTIRGAEECNVQTVLVSGGVAANSQLRKRFTQEAQARGLKVYFPSRGLSTDNAAMIAAAAYAEFTTGRLAPLDLNAKASMPLEGGKA
jgi:N6-L-threonylcarbamoyladenine synthase